MAKAAQSGVRGASVECGPNPYPLSCPHGSAEACMATRTHQLRCADAITPRTASTLHRLAARVPRLEGKPLRASGASSDQLAAQPKPYSDFRDMDKPWSRRSVLAVACLDSEYTAAQQDGFDTGPIHASRRDLVANVSAIFKRADMPCTSKLKCG